jgi:lysine 2,3-aminomutase
LVAHGMFKSDTDATNWQDWQWQLKNAIRSKELLASFLTLTKEEKAGLFTLEKEKRGLPLQITPHYFSLIDKEVVKDPLRQQVVPRAAEYQMETLERRDPLGEEDHEVVPNLIHRYPDRAFDRCASYCRFCTRKRWVGQGPGPKPEHLSKAFAYLRSKPEIKEVIISGGDPFLLSDEKLNFILSELRKIESIEIIRFDTRILTFLPMRITDSLVKILKRYQPIYVVAHFNHIQEINSDTRKAIENLVDVGIQVLNQSVLLKGINDSADTLKTLFRRLTYLRVRPYYLHQCDVAIGTKAFRVPLKQGLSFLKQMRGHVSGLDIPHYIVDIPGGFGKVSMVPDPVVYEDKEHVKLQGFDGEVASYPLN